MPCMTGATPPNDQPGRSGRSSDWKSAAFFRRFARLQRIPAKQIAHENQSFLKSTFFKALLLRLPQILPRKEITMISKRIAQAALMSRLGYCLMAGTLFSGSCSLLAQNTAF